MRISDFITFQDFPAVIRPDQVIQTNHDNQSLSWIKQYALTTPYHRKMIEEIISSMVWGQHGKAILINGLYGTGKSHLLALLYILATNESAWMEFVKMNPLFDRFQQVATYKKMVPIFFSLDDYPPTMTLEAAILFEISKSLNIALEGKSRLNDWLEISNIVRENGYHGLLLLVDELSIFLSSRSPSRREADAGFIQFIAGMTERTNLWFIGALQRGLSDTGMMKFHSWRQVEDRFKKYSLQPSQITDVIRNRMFIRHNQHDLRKMLEMDSTDNVADRLTAWPFIPNALETFMLMVNNHMSPHRTVVQVMQSLAPEWLNRDCKDVITIDQLFDSVQDELTCCISATKTYSVAKTLLDLSARAPEPNIAGKAIKTLAAFSLAEIPGVADELGKASLISDTKLLSYNLHWLRKRGAHLSAIRDTEPGKEIFSLNIDDDAGVLAATRADEIMNNFLKGDRRIYETVISACKDENWPLSNFTAEPTSIQFLWMNTIRNCAVIMVSKQDLQLADIFNGVLHDNNNECVAALIFPGINYDFLNHLVALPEEFQGCTSLITPRDITSEEYELLAEYAAWDIASKENSKINSTLENKTVKRCQERANEMRLPAIMTMASLYRQGKWITKNKIIELTSGMDSLKEIFTGLFADGLMSRFAGSVKYASAGDPPRMISRQLHQFVIDSGGVPASSSTLMHYTRLYLLPTGIVIDNENGFILREPAEEIVQMMYTFAANVVTVKEMIIMMHKAPFGLPGELSSLIIHAAIRTGTLAGYDSFMRQIDPLTPLSKSDTLTFVGIMPNLSPQYKLHLKDLCDAADISELSIFALRRYLEKSKFAVDDFDNFITVWCKATDTLPWIWQKSLDAINVLKLINIDADDTDLLDMLNAAGDAEFIVKIKNITKALEKQTFLVEINRILHLAYNGIALNRINELKHIMISGDDAISRIDEIIKLVNEIEALIQHEYSLWHESIFGQNKVSELKEIFDSEYFRFSRRLSLIHTDWPAEIYSPPAILAQAREKYCPGGLLHDFVCPRCKLLLNSASPMPSPEEAKQAATDALDVAAKYLLNSEWADNLRERMKRASEPIKEKITHLLAWSKGEKELNIDLLDDTIINWLNNTSLPVSKRNTDSLKFQLIEHDMTHKEAKLTIYRWLDPIGNLNDESVITFE